ncbi:MAG: winged helix DNA-binding domain-containing protein, partial [Ktedonobacteraceae bacterium]
MCRHGYLSDDHVRLLRLRAQRLTPQSSSVVASVAQIVKGVCGIQAQDASAATLAVRVRSVGLVAAAVEQARVQERAVIRTWGLRGTLHLLATEDLDWLLPLLGPVFVAGDGRRRAELGLDEDTCARGIRIIRNVLANQGPLTRAELVEQLAAHGLPLEGQATPHLLGRAALEGIICLGPDRGTEPTYVLLSDWVDREHIGHPLSEMAAHAELTRRYLGAYGPATHKDQATWSGMPLSKTRAVWQHIADQLMEVEVAGAPAWMLKACAAWLDELDEPLAHTPIVRLLPRFDIYLLGYQKRDLSVPPQHAKRINAGGGMIHPTVMVDGRIVGTWKSTRKRDHLDVTVEPFDQLEPQVYPGLETEIADLARFLTV